MLTHQKPITWSNFKLVNAKVHIWHASLEQPLEVVQSLEAVLSQEERQRARQFRYEEHRRSFVVSRGILRNLLSRYTSLKPDQVKFKYTLAGKPHLANAEGNSDICFNLSHAGMLVLYAFSWGRQVGIDVECIRPMDEMDQVAAMNFAPGEYREYRMLSSQDKLRAFYNGWTRKEAFIKATGDGLSFPLQEIEVSLRQYEPAQLWALHGSREEAKRWSLHDVKTWDGYAAALVVEGNDHTISHKQWTYKQFLGYTVTP